MKANGVSACNSGQLLSCRLARPSRWWLEAEIAVRLTWTEQLFCEPFLADALLGWGAEYNCVPQT